MAATLVALSPAVSTAQDGTLQSGAETPEAHDEEGGMQSALQEHTVGGAERGASGELTDQEHVDGGISPGKDGVSTEDGEASREPMVVEAPRLSRDPSNTAESTRFADSVEVKLGVRTPSLNVLMTTVDGRLAEWTNEKGRWSCSVVYGEGGPYALPRLEAYDGYGRYADNQDEVAAYGTFWVDRHAPSVTSVSLDGAVVGWFEDSGTVVVDGLAGDARLVLQAYDEQGIASAELVDGDSILDLGVQKGVTTCELVVPVGVQGFGRSTCVRMRDLAGNVRLWSLAPIGNVFQTAEADATNIPVSFDLPEGTSLAVHPERIVVDCGIPTMEITGIEEGTLSTGVLTLQMRVDDDALEQLYTCDPQREVLSITRTDDSGEVHASRVVLNDLTRTKDGFFRGDVLLAEEGDYEVRTSFKDLAGRACSEEAIAFAIDCTPPRIRIEFDASQTLFAAEQRARVVVDERHFDPELMTVQTTGACGPWLQEGSSHVAEVAFGEGTHTMSVYGADLAGNVAASQELPPFTVDTQAPWFDRASLSVMPSRRYASGVVAFARDSVALEVGVADNAQFAGARVVDAGGQGDGAVFSKDASGSKGSLAIGLREGVPLDGGTLIELVDAAGNRSHVTLGDVLAEALGSSVPVQEAVLDATAPELELLGPEPDSCSSLPQTIGLAVREANLGYLRLFDPSQTILSVYREDGGGSVDSAGAVQVLVVPISSLALQGEQGMLRKVVSEEGTYRVTAHMEDIAGNTGEASLGPFTIDTTPPIVSVSFADEGHAAVYRQGRTATICVVERHFDAALVDIETDGVLGSWREDGDVHELSVSFDSDGSHRLAVRCTDKAGNCSERVESGTFLIDQTPPTIEVSGIADGCAYAGAVSGVVTVRDAMGLDASFLRAELARGSGEEVTQPEVAWDETGATIALPDFPETPEADDVYTLTVASRDRAGNESVSVTHFSLNRFGSTFEVLNGELATGMPYLRSSPTVMVREINVSGSEVGKRSVWVTRDMSTSRLRLAGQPASGEFAVVDEDDERGWSCATYVIPRSNFTRDATYRIAVGSEDRAGNRNLSLATGKHGESREVSFVLDTTPPVLAIEGVESGQVIAVDRQTVDVMAADLVGVDTVSVLLDGQELESSRVADDVWRVQVDSQAGVDRTLQVTVHDLAGNESQEIIRGFRVEGAPSPLSLISGAISGARGQDARQEGARLADDAPQPAILGTCGCLVAGAIGVARWFRRRGSGREAFKHKNKGR